ncbi:hypothetical protein GXM_09640 [Nostoc sphaeroides CCNUC1]|uniref:Uncharacterized protein n=1 Tax=Nostoc sphaeroides CCNUC1 TaxID=2653204 RepID=A0A5P8WJ30_9NOSO|nr:hypothetical protein GXM_09640 [Nostoc sphaeroides CCNUC1]
MVKSENCRRSNALTVKPQNDALFSTGFSTRGYANANANADGGCDRLSV